MTRLHHTDGRKNRDYSFTIPGMVKESLRTLDCELMSYLESTIGVGNAFYGGS